MPGVLSFIKDAEMACEVASAPELLAAENAGFRGRDIVFDSPAKTYGDLRRPLLAGATLYLDNYQELARVDELLQHMDSASIIGVRINPQVGAGAISSTSTASLTSKFGIGLRDSGNFESLIAAFVTRPWLSSLHVHVGSQGCPLELTAQGVKEVVHLGLSINRSCGYERVRMIDIGGGLPVNFSTKINALEAHRRDVVQDLRINLPVFGPPAIQCRLHLMRVPRHHQIRHQGERP